jgi:type IV secretory pathway VirB3-like protein
MGLGLSKSFIIFFIIAVILSIWSKNAFNGLVLMSVYAVVRIIWKGLTGKSQRM